MPNIVLETNQSTQGTSLGSWEVTWNVSNCLVVLKQIVQKPWMSENRSETNIKSGVMEHCSTGGVSPEIRWQLEFYWGDSSCSKSLKLVITLPIKQQAWKEKRIATKLDRAVEFLPLLMYILRNRCYSRCPPSSVGVNHGPLSERYHWQMRAPYSNQLQISMWFKSQSKK